MNPNQNQPESNIPSIKQPGNWSPLNDYSNDFQPPKPSLFSRYKKLIIVSVIAIIVLVGLAIASAATKPKTETQGFVPGPTTSVQTANYDQVKFSMIYAKDLKIAIDEASGDQNDWLLLFAENSENSPYNLSVYVTDEEPFYQSSEEGLFETQDLGVEPINIVTSDISVAGVKTQKSIGEIQKSDNLNYYVAFTSAKVGEQYVVVSATYPKDNTQIHDSFDAMVGSIKLK